MLVIISDLHLTDGTSGETIREGAFRVFRQRLRDLAYDASWRANGKYRPIEEMDIILLGDILDQIRSTKWLESDSGVRPWHDPQSPTYVEKIRTITEAILQENKISLDILKNLSGDQASELVTIPPATQDGQVANVGWRPDDPDRLPVEVRIHYLVGNHDWFYHLPGENYNQIRQVVIDAMGLANSAQEPFPHDPYESSTIQALYEQHRVFARHGDIFDAFNYEGDRSASSLGDAIVVELLNRFPTAVTEKIGDKLPKAFAAGLKEIDNVRPSLIVPIWIDGLLLRASGDRGLSQAVKKIWDSLADEFLSLDFVRARDTFSPFDEVDKLEWVLKFARGLSFNTASQIVAWIKDKIWRGTVSFHHHAFDEPAFKNRKAQYIVYGHTHHYEVVPLDSSPIRMEGQLFNQMYLNSGTWRRVHELATLNPSEKEFMAHNVMTYFAFFKDDERRGRSFESWSGALGV